MGKGNTAQAADAYNFNDAIAWKRPSMILSCSSSLVVVAAQREIKYGDQVLVTLYWLVKRARHGKVPGNL
jgi:hypothetical protein